MIIFDSTQDSSAGRKFERWVKDNERGFFIQCESASKFMLHRTTCSHIKFDDDTDVNLAKRRKVCSNSRGVLESWAFANSDRDLQLCKDCFPEPMTLFSWGYWGWGGTTEKLVEAVDAAEAARGHEPPVFVDIRLSRAVRAKGFQGCKFAEVTGEARYTYMHGLGNAAIKKVDGPLIEIENPLDAGELLAEAHDYHAQRQRIIFFCACEFPISDQAGPCHRTTVSRLLLDFAQRRGISMRVVEWPGGLPRVFDVDVVSPVFDKLTRGAKSIPVDAQSIGTYAAIPWGSIARLHTPGRDTELYAITGPARYGVGWYLPLPCEEIDRHASLADIKLAAWQWRNEHGFEAHDC